MPVIFITGIDTGIGKTIQTGLLAKKLSDSGKTVITIKPVQTGCRGIAEDIIIHRKIMGIVLTDDDNRGETAPYVFEYPASSHLSSQLAGVTIDIDVIDATIEKFLQKYEYVLVEGSGGITSPINNDINWGDFIRMRGYDTILVRGFRLGSINHTVLSIEYCISNSINIIEVILNNYPEQDGIIAESTSRYLQERYKTIKFRVGEYYKNKE